MPHNLPDQRSFTSTATRSGRQWLVRCDQQPDVFCTAANLMQAARTQQLALALALDVPEESISVRVQPVVPDAVQRHLDRAHELRETCAWANRTAAQEVRAAARILLSEKLTYRDMGIVLGVSHQRAHQLAHS